MIVIAYLVGLCVQKATLTVVVKNVQPGKNSVVVEIWNDEKMFFKKPFATKAMRADSSVLEFSFELPPAEYAISAYQDINGNKQLDFGIFHIPKEPVAFGNNFRPKFSAPKYKDCAIHIAKSMKEEIELK